MTIEVVGKSCCGCRNCIEICPFDAISFVLDQFGFEYPKIDYEKCTDCGVCLPACPINTVVLNEKKYTTGAAYSKDDVIKFKGSSGGLFGIFARDVIQNNGVVYGAKFNSQLELHTASASSLERLNPLYKSKYLLCNTKKAFKSIEKDVKQNKLVLYCSTPCQVAALKLFLRNDYENLILLDFACHGIGSQNLFNKSIDYIEKFRGKKIDRFSFRDKPKRASSSHCYNIRYVDSSEKSGLYLLFPFYYAYSKRLALRDSCYICPYASKGRASDITLGDFHTIEKYDKTIDRFAGVSMFSCNTLKGQDLFERVKTQLVFKDFDWSILEENNRFAGSESIPASRESFLNSLANEPFSLTVKKYLNPKHEIKKLVYYYSPKFIQQFIKKIFRG